MAVETLTNEGMPTHSGDLSIEGRGIEPVPASARYGSVGRIFSVWFTPNLVPAAFFIGTLAAAGFLQVGFITGVLAIIVGNVVGSILVGLLGTMGPKTGMAQMPLARAAVRQEHRRARAPQLAELHRLGWHQLDLRRRRAVAPHRVDFVVALIVIVILQAALGVIGYEAIHTFEKYMAVVLGIMFVVLTVSILGQASTEPDRWLHRSRPARRVRPVQHHLRELRAGVVALRLGLQPLPAGEHLLVGRLLEHRPGADDLRRLARDPRPMVADKVTGTSVGTIRDDILGGGILGALAMIAIALGTVAVNAINDYTGSLSLQAAGVRIPRIVSALIVAVARLLLHPLPELGDFAGKFESYLLFISYWIAPWAAVVLVDWWLRRGRSRPRASCASRRCRLACSGWPRWCRLPCVAAVPAIVVRRGAAHVHRPADQRDQRRRPPLCRLRVSHRLRGRGARLLDRVADDQPIRRSPDGRRPRLSRLAFQPGARHRWD